MADDFTKKVLQNGREVGAKIWSHMCSPEGEVTKVNWLNALLSSALSGITFPFCLAAFQSAVFRPLRVTSNRRVVGLFCGGVSVAMSGVTASLVFLSSAILLKEIEDAAGKRFPDKFNTCASEDKLMVVSVCSKDIPLYGFVSLVVFKMLGGRFRAVLPSSLIHPGAFARVFIPAKGQSYATDSVKQALTSLGMKYGCHSCGRRWRTSFVGDHMPPNKLVKRRQKQRFYPQCTRCSNQQGAALSSLSRQLSIKTHGSSLRLYHLWIPLPIPLALLRNYVSENSHVDHANVKPDVESEMSTQYLLQGLAKDLLVLLRLKNKDNDKSDSDNNSSQ